ncbi:MAG TPA: hypothetical protein VIV60_12310 [Polyangiaceae bacterium]
MATSHNRTAILTWAALWVVIGCGGRAGEQLYEATGGASHSVCAKGDTRECTGPGACRGGQACDFDGQWASCDCGALGKGKGGQTGQDSASNAAGAMGPVAGFPALLSGVAGARPGTATGGSANRGGSSSGGTSTAMGGTGTRTSGLGGTSLGGASIAGGMGGTSSSSTTSAGSAGAKGGGTSLGGSGSGGAGTLVTLGGESSGGNASGGTTSAPNHPPVITGLSFYNTAPRSNDWLTVRVEAYDPDNDRIYYDYAWTRNGLAAGTNSSSFGGSDEFTKGDVILVTVTPRDGKDIGAPMTSGPIIVKNSAPYVYVPTIEPEGFVDDTTPIKCKRSPSDMDVDGDVVSVTLHWFLDGKPYAEASDTIAAAVTAPGQQWTCQISATDGIETAESGLSAVTYVGTKVSGIIRDNVTWLAASSPYFIFERVQLAAGITLKVEPGVRVLGNYAAFESWGNVSMEGTKDKPILADNFYFVDRSTAAAPASISLSYVQLEGSFLVGDSSGALQVKHCIFGKRQQVSLSLGTVPSNALHDFEYNVFRSCSTIESFGALTLLNNTFACEYGSAPYAEVSAHAAITATYNSFVTWEPYGASVMVGDKSADLSKNYWGGAPDANVPECIYDNNDDLNIAATAQYLPTLTAAHPDSPAPDLSYFE